MSSTPTNAARRTTGARRKCKPSRSVSTETWTRSVPVTESDKYIPRVFNRHALSPLDICNSASILKGVNQSDWQAINVQIAENAGWARQRRKTEKPDNICQIVQWGHLDHCNKRTYEYPQLAMLRLEPNFFATSARKSSESRRETATLPQYRQFGACQPLSLAAPPSGGGKCGLALGGLVGRFPGPPPAGQRADTYSCLGILKGSSDHPVPKRLGSRFN